MRVLLLTGKGGVGKTSLAVATALGAAAHGHRVFLLSTDAAHSLGDALGRPVGSRPVTVAERVPRAVRYSVSTTARPANALRKTISMLRKISRPTGDPMASPITSFASKGRSACCQSDGVRIMAIRRFRTMLI